MADWNMPDMNGLELTIRITADFPKVKTMILTMHGKQDYKQMAKAAGAKGYILKDGNLEELLTAVRNVANGELVFY